MYKVTQMNLSVPMQRKMQAICFTTLFWWVKWDVGHFVLGLPDLYDRLHHKNSNFINIERLRNDQYLEAGDSGVGEWKWRGRKSIGKG